MSINREAWLSAVKDTVAPLTDDPDALTVVEFAAIYHCSQNTARSRLRALETDGRVEAVTKWVPDSTGRGQRLRAYRLVTSPSKKRKRSV